MNHTVTILPHTEKSFVVYTEKHQTSLTNLGGIFEPKIINTQTGEEFMGWIFYINKKDEIQNWIQNGCKPVVPQISTFDKILFPPKSNTETNRSRLPKENNMILIKLKSMENLIEILNSKIRNIEIENSILTTRLNSVESEVILLKNAKEERETELDIFEHIEIESEIKSLI